MRRMLGVGFEDATIHAFGVESRLLASRRRSARPAADQFEDSHQILALFEFDSDSPASSTSLGTSTGPGCGCRAF